MKRFIALGMMIIMVLFVAGCKKEGGSYNGDSGDTIKIGAILPISGSSALLGEYQLDGIRLAVDRFNKAGGVLGKQIELVIADTASTPDTGVSEFERLVNNKSICAMIGAYNSSVTAAIAPLVIKYQVPFMVVNAVADQILAENSHYLYRCNQGDRDGYIHYINVFKYLGEFWGRPLEKIAIVAENSDWGKGTAGVISGAAGELGIQVVLNESYKNESSDLSSVITKVKNLNPDLVLPVMYINDALLFSRQMMEYDCNVTIFAHGGGFLDVDFFQKAGKTVSDYIISGSGWFTDVLDVACTQEARDISDAYIKTVGHDMNEMVVNGWLGMYVLLDAIQRAGKIDREAIAVALDETDIPADHPALMFHPYQGVKFGDDGIRYNQNIYANFSYAQMFDGKYKMFYPPEMVSGESPLVFPVPKWSDR